MRSRENCVVINRKTGNGGGHCMPIHVVIVEDDQKAASTLQNHLERYGRENDIQFRIKTFEHPLLFLEPYTAD